MFIVNENEKEYRFGDSGPKYLMKGPRMNFALVQFGPGQDFKAHYHNVMEENFFILEGEIDIVVDGKGEPFEGGRPHPYRAGRGALLHQQLERKNKNGVHPDALSGSGQGGSGQLHLREISCTGGRA